MSENPKRIVSATTPGNSAWPEVWPQMLLDDAYREGQRKRDSDINGQWDRQLNCTPPSDVIIKDLEKRIKDLNFLVGMNDEEIARLRGKIADRTAKLESLALAMVEDAKTIARLQSEVESLRRHRAGGYRVCVDNGWND